MPAPETPEDYEALASSFDIWSEEVEGLLKKVSTVQGGEKIWLGPAADSFTDELGAVSPRVQALPEAFAQTARNLRAKAKDLRESGGD